MVLLNRREGSRGVDAEATGAGRRVVAMVAKSAGASVNGEGGQAGTNGAVVDSGVRGRCTGAKVTRRLAGGERGRVEELECVAGGTRRCGECVYALGCDLRKVARRSMEARMVDRWLWVGKCEGWQGKS